MRGFPFAGKRRYGWLLLAAVPLMLSGQPSLRGQVQKIDYSHLQPQLSGSLPGEVPHFPFAAFPIDTRPMFDTFAWQSFIALMWPGGTENPGEPYKPDDPSVFGKYDRELQPVWMRWKAAFDLFPQDGSAPPAWDAPNGADVCRNIEGAQVPDLNMVSKFGSVADEIEEAFFGVLPDQTGLFTRFEVRVNRAEYDYVVQGKYYNRANWPAANAPPISFPVSSAKAPDAGAIEIKAAWRDLSKVPERFHSRFFTTETLATAVPPNCTTDPGTQRTVCDCVPLKVGLVGFHVARKTENFPQWVWSTFEQVDNLGEDPTTPPDMTPSYYDPELYKKVKGVGRANPPDHPGSSRVPQSAEDYDPTPINVVRLSAIADTPKVPEKLSTIELNAKYRALLKGTVWENYVLIGTQWSTLPSAPPQTPLYDPVTGGPDFGCEDGTPAAQGGMPFPACQVANVTLEPYHQYDSCQNCHVGAFRGGADYSWILLFRAYSPPSTQQSH
jgi:hypothetical protein